MASRYNCSAFIISDSIFSILSRSLYLDAATIAILLRRSDTILSGEGRSITCCLRRCILCHNDFFNELGSPGNDCTHALLKPVFFFWSDCSRRRSAVTRRAPIISDTRNAARSSSSTAVADLDRPLFDMLNP